jgi:hypothetical protein
MTYDVIEPKPDPSTLAIDPEDYRAAVRDFENAREAIVDAVREYTEVVEDTDVRYRIRAVVPYRVTAYRHDFDDEAVAELKSKYGRTPPGEPTDGFVDVEGSAIFRSIPHTHNQEFPVTYGDDEPEHIRDMHRRQGHEALEASVVSHVEDGEVSVPITKKVQDVVEDDPEAPTFHESKPEPKPLDYETKERTLTIGTATYKVDAIVPPEEWEGVDE